MIFDLQVNPGIAPYPVIAEAAQAADEAGFDTFWTMDHLQGSVMKAPDMPECFSLLGALSAITSRIKLGPLVVNVGNRHPGVLANCAATIQNISNGRHMLGLGAGGGSKNPTAAERLAIGITPPATMAERHAALVHVLDVLDDMWSPNRRAELDTFPLPSPRPPVVLGVNSIALATIAGARTNGVNIRAGNDMAPDILRTAIDAHRASGVDKGFTATVWEFFDEALLRGDDDRIALWESWGVDRVILLMFTGIDVPAIAAAGRYLR